MTTVTPTPNLRLNQITANTPNWAKFMNDNMVTIDAVVSAYFAIEDLEGVWENSTVYAAGTVVVDGDAAVVYRSLVTHTSAAIPSTFLQDRTANPTYWGVYSSPARSRGTWLANTSYALNDFTVNGSQYAICVQAHTSGSSFNTDLVAGKWSVLVDLSAVGSAVLPVPGGISDANKFTVMNSGGTGYTIVAAAAALGLLGGTTVGTGVFTASSAAAARTVLGAQAIGSYQTASAFLSLLGALTASNNSFPYIDNTGLAQLAAINADSRTLLAAANYAAMDTLLGITSKITAAQNIKNAVRDFGAVADGTTNNDTAFTAMETHITVTGGHIAFPRGIYLFNTARTTGVSLGGGYIGAGNGMCHESQNSGPAAGAYGTVFRFGGASGDGITISDGSKGFVIKDIGFWPVLYKTSGYEIVDRGTDTCLENLVFAYGYGAVNSYAGANDTMYRGISTFGMAGPIIMNFQGSTATIADWIQGCTVELFINYTPFPIADPEVSKTTAAWATGTSYERGAVTTANGYVWQAKQALTGTSAGAGVGPTLPAITFAGGLTSVSVTDNTVTWQPLYRENQTVFQIDSNAVVLTIDKAQILSAFYGVWVRNTLGSAIVPQSLKITSSIFDHTVGDCIRVDAGYEITLNNADLRYSATGRGITFNGTAFSGGFAMQGGQICGNALDGIEFAGMSEMRLDLNGVRFSGNGQRTNNTYDDVSVGASSGKFSARGCKHGGADFTTKVRYNYDIGAGCDNFIIKDAIGVVGVTSSINNVPGAAATRIVSDNILV